VDTFGVLFLTIEKRILLIEKLVTQKKIRIFKYINTKTGEEFKNLVQASISVGVKPTTLSAMLNGQNNNKTDIIRNEIPLDIPRR
jgi:hypothetical protein